MKNGGLVMDIASRKERTNLKYMFFSHNAPNWRMAWTMNTQSKWFSNLDNTASEIA